LKHIICKHYIWKYSTAHCKRLATTPGLVVARQSSSRHRFVARVPTPLLVRWRRLQVVARRSSRRRGSNTTARRRRHRRRQRRHRRAQSAMTSYAFATPFQSARQPSYRQQPPNLFFINYALGLALYLYSPLYSHSNYIFIFAMATFLL